MSATISLLFVCPGCGEASSAPMRPKRCPSCSYRFREPGENLATEFSFGKSIQNQFFELVQQDIEKFLDAPLNEFIKGGKEIPEEVTVHRKQKAALIRKKWEQKRDEFLMDSLGQDVNDLMGLMYHMMSLVIPSGSAENASLMVSWGKRIGKLAEILENYMKEGGKFHARTSELRSGERSNTNS